MSLKYNLSVRGRLLRTALFKRFVNDDVINLAQELGDLPVTSVMGNLEPIELLQRTAGGRLFELPDFTALRSEDFVGAPTDNPSWSSERSVAEFIGRLTALMRPRSVCEIGCFVGYTTAHIAAALRFTGSQGHLHVVDLSERYLEITRSNLARLGFADLATQHCGGSCDPEVLRKIGDNLDLVFIDTSHSYEDTVAEIAAYGAKLSARGCLLLHDSVRFPGVRRAISEAGNAYRVCTFATERGNGLTALIKRS